MEYRFFQRSNDCSIYLIKE
ncbi:hypothetical protein CAETHG_04095 [Clostridium autoethanogenum DSM 10061]|uniref:Uncharacterized protein n=1 Tax=Clostridium autoethanogenum DSM 10061 TaxID=1341692 RepID=A0ABY4TQX0_9CLOT|nr:hypothetical protein CAETHG_04095 [Clostridium autoethanogenum DSM 10061]